MSFELATLNAGKGDDDESRRGFVEKQCLEYAVGHDCATDGGSNIGYEETMVNLSRVFQSQLAKGVLDIEIIDTLNTTDTASYSVVTTANVLNCSSQTKPRVVMKWFDEEDDDLTNELKAYSCAVHVMDCPFFAFPLCVAYPDNLAEYRTDKPKPKKLAPVIKDIAGKLKAKSTETVGFVMTEYCGQTTFRQIVKGEGVQAYSGIVQIAHALERMAERGIVHGDLHFNNILFPKYEDVCLGDCEELRVETLGLTRVGSRVTPAIVLGKEDRIIKIFDWDRSSRLVTDEHELLKDRIGFLRLLPSYMEDFMNDALGDDLSRKYIEYVTNTVFVNEEGRPHRQMTDADKLTKIDIVALRTWVVEALKKVKKFASVCRELAGSE